MSGLIPLQEGLWVRALPKQLRLSDYRLIAFDMDSTLINIECIDEMAACVGKAKEVAAITEAAMQGEITDYKQSLRQRVALLEGAPADCMRQVYETRLQFNPGVERLVRACHHAGLYTLIVSGGFDYFTQRLQTKLGIHATRSNQLEVIHGRFTGRLVEQAWGDICDGEEKKRMISETALQLGIEANKCIAVGDGSNDIPMMTFCGLSVAYKAKPKVRVQANIVIDEGGIDRCLEVIQTDQP